MPLSYRQRTLLALLPLAYSVSNPAHAACTIIPTAADDTFICDSGSSSGFTDNSGNNTLILPTGGSGSIDGDVNFGAGTDSLKMHSGTINGRVYQNDGEDRFIISAGTITGAVMQGNNIDSFIMSGGQIASLAQGDALDTFHMSGGTIVGAFEDGDLAWMSGGSIGRVDMKLDNNLFDMSGGQIIGNLVTGFGKDTIILTQGRIGGNISVSGGDDSITISGGEVGGQILMSNGNDQLTWSGTGIIKGNIYLGDGDDIAQFNGLSTEQLDTPALLDAGEGYDTLTMLRSSSQHGARFSHWEQIDLTQESLFNLDDTLTLGDNINTGGTLSIDTSSHLNVLQGHIKAFSGAANAHLINAGVINLKQNTALNQLSVHGDYRGNNGTISLQSVLAGDDANSDRLIVDAGTISGSTQLNISNLGGHGGLTLRNGIQVVQALNGTTSEASAFNLGSNLSAGAYQYQLYKGGLSAGSEQSWYLRSSLPVAPPTAVAPTPAPAPAPTPSPTPPTTTPSPMPPGTLAQPKQPTNQNLRPAPDDASQIIFYRPEIPAQSAVPPAADLIVLRSISTFHHRQGTQQLLQNNAASPAGWIRAITEDTRAQWQGSTTPKLDGHIRGFQVGHDILSWPTQASYQQRAGAYLTHADLDGDVKGYAMGMRNQRSGDIDLDGDSLGLYWTSIAPQGTYIDINLMGTHFDGHNRSYRGAKLNLNGSAWSASVEAGTPIAISQHWSLEPQAQLITHKSRFNSAHDGVSKVKFDNENHITSRLGIRLAGHYLASESGINVDPWLRINVWHDGNAEDQLQYDSASKIKTQNKSTYYDTEVGVATQITRHIAVYSNISYSANLDAQQRESIQGNLGLRINW